MTRKETIDQNIVLSDTNNGRIIRQLLYYDIFDHPLTKEELFRNCTQKKDNHNGLEYLLNKKLIFKINCHYSVRNDLQLSLKRIKGEENTHKSMPIALKMAKLISKFPFVRAVALSGSISKGYMDDSTDVDYFIIAKPKRLWLARTILIMYKKIFLLNSFRFFCLNYFVDENNLALPDRNIFTATEMNTLIPVYGHRLIDSFFKANTWVIDYYKGFPQNMTLEEKKIPNTTFKKLLEFLLSNFVGNWLDYMSMRLTIHFWKWKYRESRENFFKSSFRLNRSVAKYHPGNFQERVLTGFYKNIESFKKTESEAR